VATAPVPHRGTWRFSGGGEGGNPVASGRLEGRALLDRELQVRPDGARQLDAHLAERPERGVGRAPELAKRAWLPAQLRPDARVEVVDESGRRIEKGADRRLALAGRIVARPEPRRLERAQALDGRTVVANRAVRRRRDQPVVDVV